MPNENIEYVAHIRGRDGAIQTVSQHNDGVAQLAYIMGSLYGIGKLAMFSGRHHDDGKNTPEYLVYINDASDNKPVVRGAVIHSTHGAWLINQLASYNDCISRLTAEMARIAIMSHHGLRDCISMEGVATFPNAAARVSDSLAAVRAIVYAQYGEEYIRNEFSEACTEVQKLYEAINNWRCLDNGLGSAYFYMALYERLLTSILIDADRTDTACFEDDTEPPILPSREENTAMWKTYRNQCDKAVENYQRTKFPSVLDPYRAEISKTCSEFDGGSSGIFRLVLPCSSGKTLSALRYALSTAEKYGKRHIFYIAPYNSILEQNASEISKYVGNSNAVLQHHSGIVFDSDDNEREHEKKYRLLTENWSGAPIVATSAVQFLNTLFDAKTSSIRRMQALGESVIIIDEIQVLPIKVLKLFNAAMNFLTHFCESVVVLCSATQPLLDKLDSYKIIQPESMILDEETYRLAFERVDIVDDSSGNGMSVDEAAEHIINQTQTARSVLAIVNTKAAARSIAEYIHNKVDGSNVHELFHLSTNMCASHRSDVLTTIREHLQDKKNNKKIICVSTTLIEAGVHISFERVVRSLAGLDRIVQAAGRCNRNGEAKRGIVSVIFIRDENIASLEYLREAQQVTREIFYHIRTNPERYLGGALSQKAMDEFYGKYYNPLQEREMAFPLNDDPEHTIIDLLTDNPVGTRRCGESNSHLLKQAFKKAGDAFLVIDDRGAQDVVVEYNDDARVHIQKLLTSVTISAKKKELRHLQQYIIQLHEHTIERIGNNGIRFEEKVGIRVLNRAWYDDTYGVNDKPR